MTHVDPRVLRAVMNAFDFVWIFTGLVLLLFVLSWASAWVKENLDPS